MKNFLLITAFPQLHSNQKFVEISKKMGLSLSMISPTESSSPHCDGALLRCGVSHFESTIRMGEQIQKRGKPVVNPPEGITIAKNKWNTHQQLAEWGLPQIPTELFRTWPGMKKALESPPYRRFPVIIKTLYGAKGVGVHLCHNEDECHLIFNQYAQSGYHVLMQPFIDSAIEHRVIVVGEHVFSCVKRIAASGEFRSNWHRGGHYEVVQHIDSLLKSLALKAVKVCQLDVAAVDFISDGRHQYILEINDSPGLEGIEKVTGLNLAEAILEELIKKS